MSSVEETNPSARRHLSTSARARTIIPSTMLRTNYTYNTAGRLTQADQGGNGLVYTYDTAEKRRPGAGERLGRSREAREPLRNRA